MSNVLNEIITIMKKANNILLSSHLNPDGDNIGSLLGLGFSLKELGKNVTLLQLDDTPTYLEFLKGIECFTDVIPENIDLYITLDCANKDRLGSAQKLLDDSTIVSINIDHHRSNEKYGDYNYVKEDYSSTSEVVYEILELGGFSFPQETVDALLTGISTDTGRFLYQATSSKTLISAGKLVEKGANIRKIMFHLYENESLNAALLQNEIFSNAKFLFNEKVAISSISQSQLDRYDSTMSEVDEVINRFKNIQGVELSILIKEKSKNISKVSFRSKTFVDVNDIADTFGGGGHKHASGCTINENLMIAEEKIIERLNQIEWS